MQFIDEFRGELLRFDSLVTDEQTQAMLHPLAAAFTKHVWLVAAFKKAVFPLKDPTWLRAE